MNFKIVLLTSKMVPIMVSPKLLLPKLNIAAVAGLF